MAGKNFKFMVFMFLKNALNLDIFTHAPLSQLKTLPQILTIILHMFVPIEKFYANPKYSRLWREILIYFLT